MRPSQLPSRAEQGGGGRGCPASQLALAGELMSNVLKHGHSDHHASLSELHFHFASIDKNDDTYSHPSQSLLYFFSGDEFPPQRDES